MLKSLDIHVDGEKTTLGIPKSLIYDYAFFGMVLKNADITKAPDGPDSIYYAMQALVEINKIGAKEFDKLIRKKIIDLNARGGFDFLERDASK
jgi:hypothetical protein